MKHAEGLIRDAGYLSTRQNQAIGVHDHACGKLPAFYGKALFEAMQFVSACGVGRTMGGRIDDAEDVLKEVAGQWPLDFEGIN